jgi:alkylation response protein AidB-like acyl-CoA dehydrogenase
MYDANLLAMLAPKAYDSLELHPADCTQIWEAIARIDAAAAWNLVMNQAIAAYSAWLPAKGVAELFATGIPTVAGALHPPGKAVRVDGGWRITGQVPFGSGCHHAQWLAMPANRYDPRHVALARDARHGIGRFRGDGSLHPEHLTVPVAPLRNPPPGFEGSLFRMWPWTAIIGEATVSVGVASAAVDAAVHLCKTKTPAYQGTALRDQQLAQFLMGEAGARVEAASRDTINFAAGFAYENVERRHAAVDAG